jgi:HEAT repeat protein
MRRLAVLLIGCLALGLGKVDFVMGQKRFEEVSAPALGEIPKLIKQLKDKDKDKRHIAVLKLARRGELRQEDVLEAAAAIVELANSDPDDTVRDAACYALGVIMLGGEDAVTALTKRVEEDKNLGIRRTAAASLGCYGYEARSALGALKEAQNTGAEADKALQEAQRNKTKLENEGTRRAEADVGRAAGQSIQMINNARKPVAKNDK